MKKRQYPDRPICAVGAVIFDAASVLLVRRGKPPGQDQWSIPGGAVRLGETLESAVVREALEETGLEVSPVCIGKVLERIHRDQDGAIEFHYIIVDYLCEIVAGVPVPSSDAKDLAFFALDQLNNLELAQETAEVIREIYRLKEGRGEGR
ncbi:MAG: NUDIX hydrolase [Acidobacteriota bacterium]